ncbi:MAG: bifunctional 4-hydroxy-2-oxoglutarate aldolase/2-dehydro-3-deoxy-phosphogluconate aldolase [Chitinophagaceae bacterium]|nr:bifunctional 4-hydroxy-2-oxoglutarate aldolase/2-dehydro-3-deoxy-phosphogluconate aldolase [Oligoflexus sp.]
MMQENVSSVLMGKILSSSPFLASVTLKTADAWQEVGEFAMRAGLSSIEVLLRTSHAERGVYQLKEHYPSLTIGLGTVLTLDGFQKALDCGADFAVSPGSLPSLLEIAASSSIAYIPGVMTPSEIMQAYALGFKNAKLFPAGYLGISFIKSLEGPYPDMKYCASGSVGEENWSEFAQCKSVTCISGTWIIPSETLDDLSAKLYIERLEQKHFQFAKYKIFI